MINPFNVISFSPSLAAEIGLNECLIYTELARAFPIVPQQNESRLIEGKWYQSTSIEELSGDRWFPFLKSTEVANALQKLHDLGLLDVRGGGGYLLINVAEQGYR